jgi:hypothetical protein
MRTFALALLLFMVGSSASPQAQITWEGIVTDTHCGTHCQRTSHMTPDPDCVRLCVRKGSKYGLWYKDHVYVLEPQTEAAKFAAENVRVTGSLSRDSIHILSISRISGNSVRGAN